MAQKKRKRSLLLRLLVIGVSVYMIATLTSLWKELSVKNKELSQLNSQKAAKQLDVDNLKKLLNSGSDKDIIEQAARQRLGFVYSNEEIYVDVSGN